MNVILVSAQQLYTDFESLMNLHVNGQLSGQRNLAEQFLTKFSHFILFGCNTLGDLSHDRFIYRGMDDVINTEKDIIQGQIWSSVFMILKSVSEFHQYVQQETIRNCEMSILYFLEWLSEISMYDINITSEPGKPIESSNKIFMNIVNGVNGLFTNLESFHL